MGLMRFSALLLLLAVEAKSQVAEKCFGPLSYGMSDDRVEAELAHIGIQRVHVPSEPLALKQTFSNSGVVAWDRLENDRQLQIFERKSFQGKVVEQMAEILCYFLNEQSAAHLGIGNVKGLQAVILIFDPLEKDCLNTFETLQKIVSERNGPPSRSTRKFEEPFHHHDGYTEAAIKAGKCLYEDCWQHSGGNLSIWLRIGKDLKIMLHYQSSAFGRVVNRDLENKKEVL